MESLQIQILAMIEALTDLREDSRYELHTLLTKRPEYLGTIVAEHAEAIDAEIDDLEAKAQALAEEIEMLTGTAGPGAT